MCRWDDDGRVIDAVVTCAHDLEELAAPLPEDIP